MRALILGAGSYGEVFAHYLSEWHEAEILGFLDDEPTKQGSRIGNLTVWGSTSLLPQLRGRDVDAVFAPIGTNRARVRLLETARRLGFLTPNFIHPSVIVPHNLAVGSGVYILPGTVIMPFVSISNSVMISTAVHLAHHTRLGTGVFLSSGSNIGAGISIEECAFCGIGSTVMTGVTLIGADAVIGAGAVVIRNVQRSTTVVGVPARPLRRDSSQNFIELGVLVQSERSTLAAHDLAVK